jgi:alkylated DNA nucleotide flippase Atl1
MPLPAPGLLITKEKLYLHVVLPAMSVIPHFLSRLPSIPSSLFPRVCVCLSINLCTFIGRSRSRTLSRTTQIPWHAVVPTSGQQSHLSLESRVPAGQLITYMKWAAVGLKRVRELGREMAISPCRVSDATCRNK